MTKFDLHVHTTASDGVLSPAETVRLACCLGVETVAITDHDTVAGIVEALDAAQECGVNLIPGVEISTEEKGVQAHILGYYVDYTSQGFLRWLERFRQARLKRAYRILERLESLGIHLPPESLFVDEEPGTLGRPHIARALFEAGFVGSIEEAFNRYLNPGQAAYVPRLKATPAEAVRMIREAGGIPVLAHPWCVTYLIDALVEEGLLGLEVYYRGYDACQVNRLRKIAEERGLVCTGGSDFHGREEEMPLMGEVPVPAACVRALQSQWEALQA